MWATVAQLPFADIPEITSGQSGVVSVSPTRFIAKGECNGSVINFGSFRCREDAVAARRRAVDSGLVDVRGCNAVNVNSLGFAKFLGYWLGDGWVSGERVFLCGAREDCDLLNEMFAIARIPGHAREEKTGSRISCGSKHLVAWLKENFGQYSHGKKIPVWLHAMSHEYRSAFLDGYFIADGHSEVPKKGRPVRVFTTTSKAVAIGVRVLLNQDCTSASVRRVQNKRNTTISGRSVSERPYYRVTAYEAAVSFRFSDGYGWGTVRSASPSGRKRVYNISVADDESYTADGLFVHNCQPFSSAGEENAQEDPRHLWPDMFRLVRELESDIVIGEQVSNAIRHGWLDGVFADLEGASYACGAVVLGAHSLNSPHIRQRIFWGASRLANAAIARHSGAGEAATIDGNGANTLPQRPITLNESSGSGTNGRMANSDEPVVRREHPAGQKPKHEQDDGVSRLGDSVGERPQGFSGDVQDWNKSRWLDSQSQRSATTTSAWNNFRIIECSDGASRRVESSVQCLADGIPFRKSDPRLEYLLAALGAMGHSSKAAKRILKEARSNRTSRLKGYGNAIVPQVAAAFLQDFLSSVFELRMT